MQVLPITEDLKSRYQGSGLALGAHTNKSLINFQYLRNIDRTLDVEISDVDVILDEWKMKNAIRAMASLYRKQEAVVSVGMVSSYEFVVLR